MPNYNKCRFLAEAIESVLNQTYSDFELIVVDDASTDESKDIIERFAKRDSRIVPIFHSKNLGESRSRNDGIRTSKGVFLCFLDSDDIWVENKLELQLRAIGSRTDIIAYCDWFSINMQGNVTRTNHRLLEVSGFIFPNLLRRSIIVNALVMIPMSCLKNLGRFFDESLSASQDYDLLLGLSQQFSFTYVPKALYGYRIYDGNVSSTMNRKRRYAQKARVLRRYVDSSVLTKSQRISAYENLVMCDIASRNYREILRGLMTNKIYLIATTRKFTRYHPQ